MNEDLKKAKLPEVKQWLAKPKGHYIGGVWNFKSTEVLKPINPCNREVLAEVPKAGNEQVNAAARAAQECFDQGHFRNLPAREKARILRSIGEVARKHIHELATLEALNNGKLFSEALNDDLPDCADIFDYYAGWTDKHHGETFPVDAGYLNYTRKEPLGVCGLITPWNFPLLLAMWKIAPALAAGNAVIVKPSEHTPLSILRWFELVTQEVSLPKGLINLVLGDGTTGDLIARHPGVHKVSFTGSTGVGKKIVQASGQSNLKSLSLELGGKSPNIIFDDTADLEKAIARSFHLIFSQKGEKCSEPTRFIIQAGIYDQVVKTLVAQAEAYKCGDSFSETAQQGAQNNQAQYDKILNYIQIGVQEGARLVAGGRACDLPENKNGLFIRPTIFTDVKPTHRIWQEEIFGPVLCIAKFQTEAEAISLANASDFGLAAGIWTKDISRAHRMAEQIDAGMIFINRYGCYDFSSPFGGFRQSGWGKEMGLSSMDAYTKAKSVWVAI